MEPISADPGLSAAQAAERLARDGRNALPDSARPTWLALAWQAAREPMFVLLLIGAALYLLPRDCRSGECR